jgi:hypothetical protein
MTATAHHCITCGDTYPAARHALGYQTCLDCGEEAAVAMRTSWAIVPLPKQGYTRVTNKEDLQHLNQKPR